jgi:hypothetical protein
MSVGKTATAAKPTKTFSEIAKNGKVRVIQYGVTVGDDIVNRVGEECEHGTILPTVLGLGVAGLGTFVAIEAESLPMKILGGAVAGVALAATVTVRLSARRTALIRKAQPEVPALWVDAASAEAAKTAADEAAGILAAAAAQQQPNPPAQPENPQVQGKK